MPFREREFIKRIDGYQHELNRRGIEVEWKYRGYGTWRDLGEVLNQFDNRYYVCADWLLKRLKASKRVLDVGSGLCGLAISCNYYGVHSNIVSVNPAVDRKFANYLRGYVRRNFQRESGGGNLGRAIDESLGMTFPYFAQFMPFPNQSFDLIFDCFGAAIYTNLSDLELYINEVSRLLANDGVWVIINPAGSVINSQRENLMEEVLEQVVINPHGRDLLVFKNTK